MCPGVQISEVLCSNVKDSILQHLKCVLLIIINHFVKAVSTMDKLFIHLRYIERDAWIRQNQIKWNQNRTPSEVRSRSFRGSVERAVHLVGGGDVPERSAGGVVAGIGADHRRALRSEVEANQMAASYACLRRRLLRLPLSLRSYSATTRSKILRTYVQREADLKRACLGRFPHMTELGSVL